MKKTLIVFLFISINIFPQNFWKKVSSPYGGVIGDFAFNSKNEIFSGGWWGYAGLYKSSNNGKSWEKVNNGYEDFEVYAVAINKNDDIFIGTNGRRVYRSKDNGETWEWLGLDSGYNSPECWAITFDEDGTIYATDGDWGGIYKSIDNGDSWVELSRLGCLALGINKKGEIFAGNWKGLYKSTDKGATWNKLTNGLPEITIPNIAFDSLGGMYVGTGYYSNGDGVYYSSDDGESWTNLGLKDTIVQSVCVTGVGKIFAGTYLYGLFYSDDFGKTWKEKNNGNLDQDIFRIKQNSKGELFTCSESNGGIHMSTNNGENWKRIGLPFSSIKSLGMNKKDKTFFACDYQILFRYDKLENYWQPLAKFNSIQKILMKNDSLYLLNKNKYLNFSTDNGNNWETINLVNPIGSASDFTITRSGAIIVVGTKPAISYDNGKTWENFDSTIANLGLKNVVVNHNGDIYISNGQNLYHSSDNGKSFRLMADKTSISLNGVLANDHNCVFLVTNERLLRSKDNGYSWEEISTVTPDIAFLDHNQVLYCVFFNREQYDYYYTFSRSFDDGDTWEDIGSGINNRKIPLTFFEDDSSYLYLSVDEEGLYKSYCPISSIDEQKLIVSKFNLFPNYPNPFNPTTKIRYSIEKEKLHVKLKIFDVLGREIAILVDEKQKSGEYEVEFDAKNLASGIYFYQIQAGNYSACRKMILLK